MKITRFYRDLSKYIVKGKTLVIYGPRRVGKTTLVKDFLETTNLKYRFETGDNLLIHDALSSQNLEKIKEFVEGLELIAIDEAQNIPNIGMGLKLINDEFPDISVIVTGSASFELAGQIGEPLTGRKRNLTLFPVSQIEFKELYSNTFDLKQDLNKFLIFGSYPSVFTAGTIVKKIEELNEIIGSYLLKDILAFENLKNSKLLIDLLRLLAFQIGSEVSETELGTQLGIDQKTVGKYLDLLEKSFIIKSLRGYSKNLRSEITKKQKYYFLDNGIRNALISNFNDLEVRNDIGQLWENFLVIERLKNKEYSKIFSNSFFWRTYSQKEIDYIEESGGDLKGFEIKWNENKKFKIPAEFTDSYPNSSVEKVDRENYLKFITDNN